MTENEKMDELDALLSARRFQPHSANLSERIKASAIRIPQRNSAGIFEILRRSFGTFKLPKPAYALASALMFGLIIGFGTASAPENAVTSELQTFLYDEGSTL